MADHETGRDEAQTEGQDEERKAPPVVTTYNTGEISPRISDSGPEPEEDAELLTAEWLRQNLGTGGPPEGGSNPPEGPPPETPEPSVSDEEPEEDLRELVEDLDFRVTELETNSPADVEPDFREFCRSTSEELTRLYSLAREGISGRDDLHERLTELRAELVSLDARTDGAAAVLRQVQDAVAELADSLCRLDERQRDAEAHQGAAIQSIFSILVDMSGQLTALRNGHPIPPVSGDGFPGLFHVRGHPESTEGPHPETVDELADAYQSRGVDAVMDDLRTETGYPGPDGNEAA